MAVTLKDITYALQTCIYEAFENEIKSTLETKPEQAAESDTVPKPKQEYETVESPEYEKRHVLSIKAVSAWTEEDITIQKCENRILQNPGMKIDADELIRIAKITKNNWLSDFVCPNTADALRLNIAADLVTKFKVPPELLNDKTQAIFKQIVTDHPILLTSVSTDLERYLSLDATVNKIQNKAEFELKKTYPNLSKSDAEYQNTYNAFISIEKLKEAKQKTNQLIKAKLDGLTAEIVREHDLQFKRQFVIGENNDYSFLGAAGSGKSTISRQFIEEGDKLDYVSLATDDYRGVSFENDESSLVSEQVFTRTQDSAYWIKELVEERIMAKKDKRPNIIIDCVSLEGWHKSLLEESGNVTSAVACLNDISVVPLRAYARAIDENSGPADRGRHVNTSALLSGHAAASMRLLSSIPDDMETILYDTNIPRGTPPPKLGVIDTRNGQHNIDVFNLDRMCRFLGKANVNIEATFSAETYRDVSKEKYRFTYDVHYQAESLLALVSSNPPRKPEAYEVTLKHGENQQPYAKLKENASGDLEVELIDSALFLKIINEKQRDAELLKSLCMQIHNKGLSNARVKMQELGSENAAVSALRQIAPNVQFTPASSRRNTQGKLCNMYTLKQKEEDTQTRPSAKKRTGRGELRAAFLQAATQEDKVFVSPKTSGTDSKVESQTSDTSPRKKP